MPPRWMTGAIIAFWLGTTGWMLYREARPLFRAGEPPPYHIDLTDEVSANTVSWTVLLNGEKVGMGRSWVQRKPDRSFELWTEVLFHEMQLKKILQLRKLVTRCQVSPEGRFLEEDCQLWAEVGNFSLDDIRFNVRRQNGQLLSKVTIKILGEHTQSLPPVDIGDEGTLFNPMQLVNRLTGLKEGQRWPVPDFNPLASLNSLAPTQRKFPQTEGEVSAAFLDWGGTKIPCLRIDYREDEKDQIIARTWVRRVDGLVLQQEARHLGMELILRREK